MDEEQLNKPEGPTQLQLDSAAIVAMIATINNCHYFINRMPPEIAVEQIRTVITELKASQAWMARCSPRRQGSASMKGEDHAG